MATSLSTSPHSDVAVLKFCNAVVDKMATLLRTTTLDHDVRDIRCRGGNAGCWVLHFNSKVMGKTLKFDVVFAKATRLELACHVVSVGQADMLILKVLGTTQAHPDTKLLADKLATTSMRRSVIHEVVHYVMSKRFPSKRAYIEYSNRTDIWSSRKKTDLRNREYYNEPMELEAHYFEMLHAWETVKVTDPNSKWLKSFDNFIGFARRFPNSEFLQSLTVRNRQRILARMESYWNHRDIEPYHGEWLFWLPENEGCR